MVSMTVKMEALMAHLQTTSGGEPTPGALAYTNPQLESTYDSTIVPPLP